MSPRVSQQYLEERRQQILDSAVACFSRNGLHQTTIEDIRLEAELSRGAVYHYFKTKEDIIDAIRSRSAREDTALFRDSSQGDDPIERLTSMIDAAMDRVISPESASANRLALFLWAEALVNGRIMRGQRESVIPYHRSVEQAVREAQSQGRIDQSLDPAVIAVVVNSAILGLQVHIEWMPELDLRSARDILTALITGGFSQGP